jgi:predicted RNase H-like HicB family nuclease
LRCNPFIESVLFHAQFLFKSRHGRRLAAAYYQHALPRRHALALAKEFSDSFAMRKTGKQEFSVVVERDEEGYYVASVPALPGCHTQARSLDKLMERVREAIQLCLEVEHESTTTEFIGVQRVAV